MKSVQITNLFGRFNYEINLDPDMIIITGPNGFGKSTILKILYNLTQGLAGLSFFNSIDFDLIKVNIDSKRSVKIKKNTLGMTIDGVRILQPNSFDLIEDRLLHRPSIVKKGPHFWYNRRDGRTFSTLDYIYEQINKDEEEQDYFVQKYLVKNNIIEIRKRFEKIQSEIGNISLITEQRLLKETTINEDVEIENVIDKLPEKIKGLFRQIQEKYSVIASDLDSSYPTRLFSNTTKISKKQFVDNIVTFNSRFSKLSSYGLNLRKDFGGVEFSDEHAKAFKVYFDDLNKKYKIYDDFIQKIELYMDIVNHRLTFKEIGIDRENGIVVYDKDDRDKKILLNRLSSGEKQEIVMFFDLIFGTEDDLLLLIDEPEISLHIAWQKKFIEDLHKIVDLKKLKVIVATHSPQIINNRWDIQVDLGELYGG